MNNAIAVTVVATFAALALVNSPAPAGAAEPCTHDQICGLKNAEDLVWLAGTRWAIASQLAKDPEPSGGGFSLMDLERRTARVLMPDVSQPAASAYADCPGAPVASEL